MDVLWQKVNGASYYKVKYRVSGGGIWVFTGMITTNEITVADLAANTLYDFSIASYCPDHTTAGYSAKISKTTQKCTAPSNPSVTALATSAATITWTPVCGSNNFNLHYRVQGTSTWLKVNSIQASSYNLSLLQSATAYEYRLQTNCDDVKSSWSSVYLFTTLSIDAPRKNILLIVLDDARYDAFIPNGAPSWFKTPAINSIASEGVNFKLMIPTTSQCAPSRACIYTGVYPHINGVEKNGDTLDASFPLIQQILKDQGFYTGFIGKYGQFLAQPKGFNWWATSDGDVYVDPTYTINGNDTLIPGHISDVYPDLAKTFLNSVPADKNFVLFYFMRVPHDPTIPRTQDAQLYENKTLPFPSNFPFYTNTYPSFYTDQEWNADSADVKELKLATYQTLKGAEDNVDSLLTWIMQRDGTLDSTLIIFTSDNGYLMGEHHLHEKILGLEESIRVPLFIRYPGWFAANSVITDQIGSNLDIAATLLDFANLPNNYGFQGLSFRQLANGQQERKSFLYETGWDPYVAKLRAVRTLDDIYIRSYCKTNTEEFYNLVNDPRNDTNQIFNPLYSATIAQHRALLDSLRAIYNDFPTIKTKTCNLVTNGQRIAIYKDDEAPELELAIGPNPAANSFTVYFNSHKNDRTFISVIDELGRIIWKKSYDHSIEVLEEMDCTFWNTGVYLVKADQEGKSYSLKMLISR